MPKRTVKTSQHICVTGGGTAVFGGVTAVSAASPLFLAASVLLLHAHDAFGHMACRELDLVELRARQDRPGRRTTSGSLLMFSTGAAGTICARGSRFASSPPRGACSLFRHTTETLEPTPFLFH